MFLLFDDMTFHCFDVDLGRDVYEDIQFVAYVVAPVVGACSCATRLLHNLACSAFFLVYSASAVSVASE